MSFGLLVHFNFGPGLVPEQSYALLVTYLLGFDRLYLSLGTVRRAGIARAPCPAPCAVLRLPDGEITEAHILTHTIGTEPPSYDDRDVTQKTGSAPIEAQHDTK